MAEGMAWGAGGGLMEPGPSVRCAWSYCLYRSHTMPGYWAVNQRRSSLPPRAVRLDHNVSQSVTLVNLLSACILGGEYKLRSEGKGRTQDPSFKLRFLAGVGEGGGKQVFFCTAAGHVDGDRFAFGEQFGHILQGSWKMPAFCLSNYSWRLVQWE